jgi:SAM-dependent methyltransferase
MDNKTVYENFDWESFKSEALNGKIEKVIESIPFDVKSILDIGCGNGLITNQLANKYEVTAVDRSEQALKFVKTKKIQASASNIPLNDNSFDLVFSSELLEHLPDDILNGTVSEINRLSKKYIFITVPNNENPDKLLIQCPECKYIFNSPNHLRSFDVNKLKSHFPDYKLINTFAYGKKVRYYNRKITYLKRNLVPSKSWLPIYWMPKEKRNTTCPSCEYKFENPFKFNIFSFGLDMLNIIVSTKKPYWLFAVFEKK